MTRNPITISPDHTNREAIQLLLKHNISGLFVVDADGKLCGVITEFALLDMLYDAKMLDAPVGDYMTKDVSTVEEMDMLTDAANVLILHRFRRLPVVADGKPVGIISRHDLLRFIFNSASSEKVGEYQDALTRLEPVAK